MVNHVGKDQQGKASVRILVVEDDAQDQELLLHQLRKTQMAGNVLFVPDGLQALECIRESKNWELGLIAMFLDIHLPGMSGIELLKRIRRISGMEDFPVIVMTSSTSVQDREDCQKLKVMSYVQKPVTIDSFSKAIADIFHFRPSRNGN